MLVSVLSFCPSLLFAASRYGVEISSPRFVLCTLQTWTKPKELCGIFRTSCIMELRFTWSFCNNACPGLLCFCFINVLWAPKKLQLLQVLAIQTLLSPVTHPLLDVQNQRRKKKITQAGVYHPHLNVSHYVNPKGMGITNTISRAELTAIATAVIHIYSNTATYSLTSLNRNKKQLSHPNLHRHHIQGDVLQSTAKAIRQTPSPIHFCKVPCQYYW
jgi:hypothetical protein